jgi:hypothetical protein
MRWMILMIALSGPTFAQSIVLTEAFADSAGELHFAVTKVLHVEGVWRKHPLEIGTIIDPPSTRRAYPLRRFGENVLFVLPQSENLRAYWSYNVHNGFVPGVAGRPLSEVVSLLIPPIDSPQIPTAIAVSSRRGQPERFEPEQEKKPDINRATHDLIIAALQAPKSPE